MNLDRTFCTGLRCGKGETCNRWIGHLDRWMRDRDVKGVRVSIAEYGDHDGKCDRYHPVQAKEQT